VQTASGALVAFAEARDGGDSSASRIGVRTSSDGGVSWTDVAFPAGAADTPAGRAACNASRAACRAGNPAAVYDAAAARVVLVYVLRGFDGGGGEDAVGNAVVFSSDDGATWTAPRDVSDGFGAASGSMPGPGTALQLAATASAAGTETGPEKGTETGTEKGTETGTEKGTEKGSAVVVTRARAAPPSGRLLVASHHGAYQHDCVTYSDDGGLSWRTINQTFPGMDEAALTQLPNGSVQLNMRHTSSPTTGRAVALSSDGGATFGPIRYDPALVSPVCQASIVSFGGATYFSNPASTSGRKHLTIRKSTDNAASWDAGTLLVQAGASAGYSCLVKGALHADTQSGGILFEASDGTLKFGRFPLSLA